jgi:hypothetical protein
MLLQYKTVSTQHYNLLTHGQCNTGAGHMLPSWHATCAPLSCWLLLHPNRSISISSSVLGSTSSSCGSSATVAAGTCGCSVVAVACALHVFLDRDADRAQHVLQSRQIAVMSVQLPWTL